MVRELLGHGLRGERLMKKVVKKRLTVDRECLKTLIGEISREALQGVRGGEQPQPGLLLGMQFVTSMATTQD
jgi:hypothetical protein